MSNYSPIVNYAAKDALTTGDPAKKILGTEISAELTAIASMSSSKEDTVNKGAASGYAGLDASAKLLDSLLSSNVPLKDGTNTFTAGNTFNGTTTFSGNVSLSGGTNTIANADISAVAPQLRFIETGVAADTGRWRHRIDAAAFAFAAISDDNSVVRNILTATRGSGAAVATIGVGNASDAAPITLHGSVFVRETLDLGNLTDATIARGGVGFITVEGERVWSTLDFTEAPSAGTYTPTITNGSNVAASTAHTSQWMRVGDTVTVSGEVDIDPAASLNATEVGISLPVASNFAQTWQCSGTGADSSVFGAGAGFWVILGDAANNRATLRNEAISGTTNRSVHYHFTYLVV